MVFEIQNLLFWAVITFVTPLIIAIIPIFKFNVNERTLHLMLGLSAGILGGITFIDILPEAFNVANESLLPPIYTSLGIAFGFFVLFIIERYLLHFEEEHGGHFHIHKTVLNPSHGKIGISALAVHGFIDGFVIPIGFLVNVAVGTAITLAVVIHQIPDSFAALSISLGSGKSKVKTFAYVLITALDTPVGIAIGLVLANLSKVMIPLGLGISAGTFIYVMASDLVPELQHRTRSSLVVMTMIIGFLIVAAISLLLPRI